MKRRAPWRPDDRSEWTRFPIARIRYAANTKAWTLYWRDRNLRFHLYNRVAPTTSIEDIIIEIGRDPTGIFWG